MATLIPYPSRAPLLALAAVAVLSVAGTAAFRWSSADPAAGRSAGTAEPVVPRQATAVQWRTLRFSDTADHGIAVHDAATHALLDTLQGEQGFVRGVLRAMTRERRLRGVSERTAAFELAISADGRLTLRDPATDLTLDLRAFGPTNAGAFARLLRL